MALSTKLIAFIAGAAMLIPNASSRMYLEKKLPDAALEENEEILEIHDVYAWVGFTPSDIIPKTAEDISYDDIFFEYDKSKIRISKADMTIEALEPGDTTVRAYTEKYETFFTAKAREIKKNKNGTSLIDSNAEHLRNMRRIWDRLGTNGKTTIFIGDSFFDTRFWQTFYRDLDGYDAVCIGLGGATTYDWEILPDTLLLDVNPKNAVINIGTNNVYAANENADDTTSGIIRMLSALHEKMPDTKLYYFGISYRNDGGENPEKLAIIREVNENVSDWCSTRDYITFIDIYSSITSNLLTDGLHPTVEGYKVFINALEEAGADIEKK